MCIWRGSGWLFRAVEAPTSDECSAAGPVRAKRSVEPRRLAASAVRILVDPVRLLALLECGVLMAAAELVVRHVRIERAAQWFGATLSFSPPDPSTELAPLLLGRWERVRLSMLARVASRWPFSPEPGGSCLRQSLAAAHVLRRRQPKLRFGVARDPVRGLLAHAWLEVEGRAATNPGYYKPLLSSPGPA